jgi:hypothetical protein
MNSAAYNPASFIDCLQRLWNQWPGWSEDDRSVEWFRRYFIGTACPGCA